MDESTFRWIIGGLSGGFFLMFGWIFKRQADQAHESAQSRAKQWDAINELRKDHHNLALRTSERMFTKDDAREMETRITSAIKDALK